MMKFWRKQTELQKLMSVGAIMLFGAHVWSVATCPGFEHVPGWQVTLAGIGSVAAGMLLPYIVVKPLMWLAGESS